MFKYGKTVLLAKLKEASSSVLPIAIIVAVLCFTVVPVENGILVAFLLGVFVLIFGMGLFTLGVDLAMTPMGENVGSYMTKSKKLWFILFVSFLIGTIVTVSEPDLQVLAAQIPGIPAILLIGVVAISVGIFLLVAMLRILFKINLSIILVGSYILLFILAFFVPKDFLAFAFDSGGVTTGPMTVPFIMALGVGVAAMRSDKDAERDSFGLVALSSVGPILSVMILGLLYRGKIEYNSEPLKIADSSQSLSFDFMAALPEYMKEVLFALIPMIVFFTVFQIFFLKLKKSQLIRIGVGLLYTYIGLVLFLTGANTGFLPVARYIGDKITSLSFGWIIVPVGMLLGYFIVSAEPAVHVLNKQVYEMTAGAIPKGALGKSLSIGVAISVGLSMLRILTGIPILYILIPGYAIALILTAFTPKMFTAIAFDSGGVASGPMTTAFLLPLAIGACTAAGGNEITDAFGVVAMVAMTPLITIQILGISYKEKAKRAEKAEKSKRKTEEIIEFDSYAVGSKGGRY